MCPVTLSSSSLSPISSIPKFLNSLHGFKVISSQMSSDSIYSPTGTHPPPSLGPIPANSGADPLPSPATQFALSGEPIRQFSLKYGRRYPPSPLSHLNSAQLRTISAPVVGDAMVGLIGGFSHDSEHDLMMMLSDFLENGSSGAESRYNSDSDSGKPDLSHLADRVLIVAD